MSQRTPAEIVHLLEARDPLAVKVLRRVLSAFGSEGL